MRVQLPGLTLAYDAAGSGRPVLLIHGFPLNRSLWQPQLDLLPDLGTLIAPDLRGHGDSQVTPAPYSMDQLARDCVALLDGLGARQPAVIGGLSMGGYVALAFCRLFPERVAGLILAATRAGADSEEGRTGRDKMAATARAEGAEAVVAAMLPKMLAPDNYAARPDLVGRVRAMMAATPVEGIVGALQGMRDRPDSRPRLGQVQQPALVLHGLEDQLFPPAEAEATAAALPNSRLQLVPHAGHLLNLEQPEAFNAAVRVFVEGL